MFSRTIMLSLALLLQAGCSHFTPEQVWMNAAITMDWSQTRYIADNPDTYHEKHTPLLDEHPTTGDVNKHFVSYLLLMNGVYTYVVPTKYKRDYALTIAIGHGAFTLRNAELGIHGRF